MSKFIKKIITSCWFATSLSFVLQSQTANAFLVSPGSLENSIAWDFVTIAQGKLNQDISYPMCLPLARQNTEEGAIFLGVTNRVADAWNEHHKSAIGDEWPINKVTFHTNISEADCNREKYLHESGVTIQPFKVRVKDGTFAAGSHSVSLPLEKFDTVTHRYTIYLHEYGHVLGLSDDYKGSYFQGGRPPSMMKMHVELQEEDKAALKYKWDNRGNYNKAQCPDTHFTIEDGLHGVYWAAGAKSCLPYLKDSVVNNHYLEQYNITNPDNCIIFMDDPNADISSFNGSKWRQERYRENTPQEYFAGAPTHAPICLSEKDSSGNVEPLSVFLNIDNLNKADSLWVGSNVHANIRMLKKQPEGRYLTVKESKYYYPYAWFHNQWTAFDKEIGETREMDFDAFSISIVDKNKEMVAKNIAPLDLTLSEKLNPMTWPEPEVITQIIQQQPSVSCDSSSINKSGVYTIARDVLSDQEVYCEVDEAGLAWTYLGFVGSKSHFKPFFHYGDSEHYSDHVSQVQNLDTHEDEHPSYSNGLASKLLDNQMLIKVKDFNNGPKIYLDYDRNIPFLNDMYHRICEDNNTYDVRVKMDWPDDEREQWTNKEKWPDNEYHNAEISCHLPGELLHQQVNVAYKNKNLGENGNIFSIKLNIAFGVKLHNQEWTQDNLPENPLEKWRAAQKNQKSWMFVRNSHKDIVVEPNTDSHNTGSHEWAFNEGNGNVVSNSSGTYEAIINGANWVTGYVNSGLDYNGQSDSVEISGATVNTLNSFSVSAWVKFNSLEGWQTAVSQDGPDISGFYLQKTRYGRFAFTLYENNQSFAEHSKAEADLLPVIDKWYHLVGVHDAASQEIKLFVDGELESTEVFTAPWSATGNTVIGRGRWGGRNVDHFSGTIDEVKTYKRALTETDVATLFSSDSL